MMKKLKLYAKFAGLFVVLALVVAVIVMAKKRPGSPAISLEESYEKKLKGKLNEIVDEIDSLSDTDVIARADASDIAGDTVDASRAGRDDSIRSILSRLGRKGRDMGNTGD